MARGPALKIVRNSNGFTLLEIMIVVAIVAILATVLNPLMGGVLAKARYARVVSDMETIAHVASDDFYNRGEWEEDGNEGQLPTGFQPYLRQWPTPPCPGWQYDWENWLDANGNGVIQVSLRPPNCRSHPVAGLYEGVYFYYPVASYGDSAVSGIGGNLYMGYAPIMFPPDRHFYCTE